jgi:transcriptional regulator with GAF, ATPase, and Fis domain
MEEAERSHILQVLDQTGGIVGGLNGAAARLGLPRTTLISKMKRLGMYRG